MELPARYMREYCPTPLSRTPGNRCCRISQACLGCSFDLLVNDASNSTIGILQGYLVVLRTRELSQAVYTLTTAVGTLQMAGLLSIVPPDLESGTLPRLLAVTGGGPLWFRP